MKKLAAAAALAAALLMGLAATAGAHTDGAGRTAAVPDIHYGVSDDGGKYADVPATFFSLLKGANLTEDRWTLNMDQNNPTAITEGAFLDRAGPAAQAAGVQIVLALYATTTKDGSGNVTHSSQQDDPTAFCNWAAIVANKVKGWGIHNYVVWNEPNTAVYWAPQDSSSPAKYEALLAKCYDTIHAADANATVIGFGLSPRSNGPSQTSPKDFIAGVAAAYKASGRTTPIMDQLSIHPYPNPNSPTDSPDVGYANTSFYGIPNLDRVKQWIYDGFNGTGQPTTVSNAVRKAGSAFIGPLTFRIDELGWQSDTTAYSSPYYHTENVATVSEQTQANYMQQAAAKYFACDPTVTDVEYFLLEDEATRDGKDTSGATIGGGWQSGIVTPDGKTKKIAYSQDAPTWAADRSACTTGFVNWKPAGSSAGGGNGGGSSGNGGSTGSGGGTTQKKPKCTKKQKLVKVGGKYKCVKK